MRKGYTKGNSDWYLQIFENFEQSLNGLTVEPIHEARKMALRTLGELGFPTLKNEEWKYTNVSPITDTDFQPVFSFDSSAYQRQNIQKFLFDNLDVYLMVFINGHYIAHLSQLEDLPEGLHIEPVSQAISRKDPDVLNKLGQFAHTENESFTALNTAFILNGAFIRVGSGAIIEKPVHLLFLSSSAAQPVLHQPRNLILLGENSQAKIIETYSALDTSEYFTNVVTEIQMDQSAVLEHFKLQAESERAFHIGTVQVHQARSSNYISHSHTFGGKIVRNNMNTTLDDEGIESTLNGVYVGTDDQLIDNHTAIDHAKPNCHSIELYKGILDDRARGVFNGKIFVRQDAQKTNAIQSNNCILLSDNATIDTKPQLEIFADDVRCTHGATIGQLDEDAFFYMRARGIERTRARNLLIHAFAADVFDRIEIEPIRERIIDLFTEKLHTVRPV